MRAEPTRHSHHLGYALAWCCLSVLVLAGLAPAARAGSEQLDDRDRSVDWAIGGLERGSRLPRSSPAPAGASRKAPGAKVGPGDTGAARSGRATTGSGAQTSGGGRAVSTSSPVTSGQGNVSTSQSSSSGGTAGPGGGETGGAGTEVGGGTSVGGEAETGTGGTGGAGEPTAGGEATEGGLGIHVETDTSGGQPTAGVEVNAGDTSLETGTAVETGTETSTPALGGQVDVEAGTEPSGTDLVGSADLTGPATIDTTTSTELDSTLAGGGDDASVDQDAMEETVGDNADDCSVAGLIGCPAFP